jgi:putative restriction endonuclease
MILTTYQERFSRLVVNVRQGRASPHKICMLLAVLDLARSGALKANRIDFAPPLLERYSLFFGAVRGPTDHPNAYFPFFHLAGKLRGGLESFWHLQPLPGRSVALGALSTARSVADITNNVAYAKLDEGLFGLLQNPEAIDALSEVLARRWFDRGLQDLHAVVGRSSEISRYERSIRSGSSLQARETQPPSYVRSPAFRRVVVQVYDYRCAATGLRLLLDSGEAMVEAAHIHPFSEAGDDDPRNGLALTPNMHWAMDKNLIAPGPDYVWHVSRAIDARIADYQPLFALEGQPLLQPKDRRMWPKQEVLAWRLDRLRDRYWVANDELSGGTTME